MKYRVVVPPIENTYSQGYILLLTNGGVVSAKISKEEIFKIDLYFEEKYLPPLDVKELLLEKDMEGNYLFLEIPADKLIGKYYLKRISFVDGIVNEHFGNVRIYTEE